MHGPLSNPAGASPRESDLELVAELRRLARSKLERLPPGQTLQPTALVNEVYVRLLQRGGEAPDRESYLLRAARVMQDVLVENARHKASLRAGGAWRRSALEGLSAVAEASPEEVR